MSIYVYDLYGFVSDDIDNLALVLGEILQIELKPHHSAFLGDYYRYGRIVEESFILQKNYVFQENDWTEPQFMNFPCLFYVNRTERSKLIEDLLKGKFLADMSLLRHKNKSKT